MSQTIPGFVQEVYRHNNIPEEEWQAHYEVDSAYYTHGRDRLSSQAATVYRHIARSLAEERSE